MTVSISSKSTLLYQVDAVNRFSQLLAAAHWNGPLRCLEIVGEKCDGKGLGKTALTNRGVQRAVQNAGGNWRHDFASSPCRRFAVRAVSRLGQNEAPTFCDCRGAQSITTWGLVGGTAESENACLAISGARAATGWGAFKWIHQQYRHY